MLAPPLPYHSCKKYVILTWPVFCPLSRSTTASANNTLTTLATPTWSRAYGLATLFSPLVDKIRLFDCGQGELHEARKKNRNKESLLLLFSLSLPSPACTISISSKTLNYVERQLLCHFVKRDQKRRNKRWSGALYQGNSSLRNKMNPDKKN